MHPSLLITEVLIPFVDNLKLIGVTSKLTLLGIQSGQFHLSIIHKYERIYENDIIHRFLILAHFEYCCRVTLKIA